MLQCCRNIYEFGANELPKAVRMHGGMVWKLRWGVIHLRQLGSSYCERLLSRVRMRSYIHCVQKKTPTHIIFHISMNDV